MVRTGHTRVLSLLVAVFCLVVFIPPITASATYNGFTTACQTDNVPVYLTADTHSKVFMYIDRGMTISVLGEIVRSTLRLLEPIGAARGMINIPAFSNLVWVFVFVALTLYVSRNFIYSKFGRACIAIRENEIAASAMTVDTAKYKVLSFTFAAFIAGVAGGIYAHTACFIQPDTFSFVKSSDILVYLYAGGVR